MAQIDTKWSQMNQNDTKNTFSVTISINEVSSSLGYKKLTERNVPGKYL